MDDAAALAVGPDLIHDFRAVDRAERLPTEEVLPDVGDGAAARPRLRGGALREKKNKPTLGKERKGKNFSNSL